MSDKKLPKSPVFIPMIRDKNIFGFGSKQEAVLLEAHLPEYRGSVLEDARTKSDFLFVMPVTHHLMFKDAQEKDSFKKLGYPKMDTEKLYSDAKFRQQELVHRCIQDQIKKGASAVICPFFHAEDTDDTKFTLNLTLISDSIHYCETNTIELPLFAMIHIGKTLLTQPLHVKNVINRYADDYGEKIGGFIVAVDALDCEDEDTETLLGLADLVYRLAETKPVVVHRIGLFGEVLCAIGAYGYTCGLGTGETFSVKNLQDEIKGPRKQHKRVYVPEVFDYINEEAAKKINYTCKCLSCNGQQPTWKSKEVHIYHRKKEVIKNMRKLQPEKRISYMRDRLSNSLKLITVLRKKYGLPFKTSHVTKWRDILESVQHWKPSRESAEELGVLLADLENENG